MSSSRITTSSTSSRTGCTTATSTTSSEGTDPSIWKNSATSSPSGPTPKTRSWSALDSTTTTTTTPIIAETTPTTRVTTTTSGATTLVEVAPASEAPTTTSLRSSPSGAPSQRSSARRNLPSSSRRSALIILIASTPWKTATSCGIPLGPLTARGKRSPTATTVTGRATRGSLIASRPSTSYLVVRLLRNLQDHTSKPRGKSLLLNLRSLHCSSGRIPRSPSPGRTSGLASPHRVITLSWWTPSWQGRG